MFKMNAIEKEWEPIDTLHDNSLFLGTKSSLSCRASDFEGCHPNSVYFTDYLNGEDTGIYNVSNDTVERFPGFEQLSFLHSVWVEPIP